MGAEEPAEIVQDGVHDTTREEVEAFCRALHLRPRVDPTNKDTNLLRNAVRHKVLPQLEGAVDREVKATLARTADNLRFDADLLQQLSLKAFDDIYEEEPEGFAFPAAQLVSLPQALATRVVRTALYKIGLAPPSSEHIDAVLDLASGRPGRRRDLPGGLLATRERGYVRVSRTRSGG